MQAYARLEDAGPDRGTIESGYYVRARPSTPEQSLRCLASQGGVPRVNVASLVFDVLEAIKSPKMCLWDRRSQVGGHVPNEKLNRATVDAAQQMVRNAQREEIGRPVNSELRRLSRCAHAESGSGDPHEDLASLAGRYGSTQS